MLSESKPTFRAWLMQQKTTHTMTGMFIGQANHDSSMIEPEDWKDLKRFLESDYAQPEYIYAAKRVWDRYQDYLKRHEAAHE